MNQSLAIKLATLTVLLGATLLLQACPDQGTGQFNGDWLLVEDCEGVDKDVRLEPFKSTLAFMGLDQEALVANIRFANRIGRTVDLDQLNMSISRVDQVREELGRDGFVAMDLDLDDRVRLALAPMDSCIAVAHPIEGVNGVVRFERFDKRPGGRVVGSAVFDLVNGRTGDIVGEGFEASFDFEIRNGSPYTAFTSPFVD